MSTTRRGVGRMVVAAGAALVVIALWSTPAAANHQVTWGIGSPDGPRATETEEPTMFAVSVSLDGQPLAGWPMSARVLDASGELIDTIEFATDGAGNGQFTAPAPGEDGPLTVELCDDDGCVYGESTLSAPPAAPSEPVTSEPRTVETAPDPETAAPPEDEPTDVVVDPTPARAGGSSFPWVLLGGGGVLLALLGAGLFFSPIGSGTRTRDGAGTRERGRGGGPRPRAGDDDEEDPRDVPVGTSTHTRQPPEGAYCDWEVIVHHARGAETIRRARGVPCCRVELRVQSSVARRTPNRDESHEHVDVTRTANLLRSELQAAESQRLPEEAPVTELFNPELAIQRRHQIERVTPGGLGVQVLAQDEGGVTRRSVTGRFRGAAAEEGGHDQVEALAQAAGLERGGGRTLLTSRSAATVDEQTHVELDILRYCPPGHRDDQDTLLVGRSTVTYAHENRCGNLVEAACRNALHSSVVGGTWLADDLEYAVDDEAFTLGADGKPATIEVDVLQPGQFTGSLPGGQTVTVGPTGGTHELALPGGMKLTSSFRLVQATNHDVKGTKGFTGGDEHHLQHDHYDVIVHNRFTATASGEYHVAGDEHFTGLTTASATTVHDVRLTTHAEHPVERHAPCAAQTCDQTSCRCDPRLDVRFLTELEGGEIPYHAIVEVEGQRWYLARRDETGPWQLFSAQAHKQWTVNM